MPLKLPSALLALVRPSTESGGSTSGGSSLGAKRERIAYRKEHELSIAALRSLARSVATELHAGVWSEAAQLYRVLEPAPLARARQRRRHEKRIQEAEEEADELRAQLQEQLWRSDMQGEEEKAAHAQRKRRLREQQPHEARRTSALQAAQQTDAQAATDDFHTRWALQREERIQQQQEQQQQHQEEEGEQQQQHVELHAREERAKLWAELSAQQAREARELKEAREKRVRDAACTAMHRDEEQYAQREESRVRMQVEGPSLSAETMAGTRSLGVYGIPVGEGSRIPGVDDYQVQLWSSLPISDFEEKVTRQQDAEAAQQRVEALYAALNAECQRLQRSMDRMCTLREAASRDLVQVQRETQELAMQQRGPPRREAYAKEVELEHRHKTRAARLRRHADELQHGIDTAENKRRSIEAQALAIAQQIAAMRESNARSKAELQGENSGHGRLPMVIGRSIEKVPGLADELTANPRSTLEHIVHASRVKLMQAEGKMALTAHKERTAIDRNLFALRMGWEGQCASLEHSICGMAAVKARLTDMTVKHAKQSLLAALQAFFRSEEKLRHVRHMQCLIHSVHMPLYRSCRCTSITRGRSSGGSIDVRTCAHT
jgi:hypothetical protein